MAVLPDHVLHALGPDLCTPFAPELVNPASIDVRLGNRIFIEGNVSEGGFYEDCIYDHGFALFPGQFILAETLEYVNIPSNVAAFFSLKSSRAREGLQHLMAGFVDPGWSGRLTLELHNSRQNQILVLKTGMRIGQLVLHRMESAPLKDYSQTGRYQGAVQVEESKG